MQNESQIEEGFNLPPHSMEAEQSVLGGLLIDSSAWEKVSMLVSESDFYRHEHRLIFRIISKLCHTNRPADIITVEEALKREELIEEAGGFNYLIDLSKNIASVVNIEHYAEIIRERSVMRRLAQVGTEIARKAYNPQGKDVNQMLDEAESAIFQIAESNSQNRSKFLEMPEMLEDTVALIEKAYLRENKDDVTGISTGFIDLDKLTAGLHGGDLIIVAGRPAMGKTAFTLNIAENVAISTRRPVAIFSMEMGGVQLVMRMLGSVGKIDQSALRKGLIGDEEWGRLESAVGQLVEAPIFVDESGALTALEVRSRVRRLAREQKGLGLVIIDYLQLMSGTDKHGGNRVNELGEISRSLKALARELNVPIIALSQLSRKAADRTGGRPLMSDLRDSGAIEQDADIIIFMHREEYYNRTDENAGLAECIIAKHRNGPTDTVHLTFTAEYTRFDNSTFHFGTNHFEQ